MLKPPSPEMLHKLLLYEPDTGLMYWRERTPDMFRDGKWTADRICKMWNAKNAGREALNSVSRGYRRGKIYNRLYFTHRVVFAMETGAWRVCGRMSCSFSAD